MMLAQRSLGPRSLAGGRVHFHFFSLGLFAGVPSKASFIWDFAFYSHDGEFDYPEGSGFTFPLVLPDGVFLFALRVGGLVSFFRFTFQGNPGGYVSKRFFLPMAAR